MPSIPLVLMASRASTNVAFYRATQSELDIDRCVCVCVMTVLSVHLSVTIDDCAEAAGNIKAGCQSRLSTVVDLSILSLNSAQPRDNINDGRL